MNSSKDSLPVWLVSGQWSGGPDTPDTRLYQVNDSILNVSCYISLEKKQKNKPKSE